ncbi:MAG TPA: response regulator, partial [Candidatus Acidoferrales bacterium]|nr:response regulator [Candidatus Acidoferrales bacterium]
MPRRVLIADDNASVRKVLRNYFASRADLELCGEASNGREAIDLALAHKPDLLILDVVMPELNGIEVSGVLKDELPNARIILFTLFG